MKLILQGVSVARKLFPLELSYTEADGFYTALTNSYVTGVGLKHRTYDVSKVNAVSFSAFTHNASSGVYTLYALFRNGELCYYHTYKADGTTEDVSVSELDTSNADTLVINSTNFDNVSIQGERDAQPYSLVSGENTPAEYMRPSGTSASSSAFQFTQYDVSALNSVDAVSAGASANGVNMWLLFNGSTRISVGAYVNGGQQTCERQTINVSGGTTLYVNSLSYMKPSVFVSE